MKNYNSIQLLQNTTNDIMPVLVYPILSKHTKIFRKILSRISYGFCGAYISGLVSFNQDEEDFGDTSPADE